MIIKKILPFLYTLNVNLSSNIKMQVSTHLPECGNLYFKQIYLPVIGNQEIEIECLNNNLATIKLSGVININGTSKMIYNNKNNNFDFDLSDNLKNIMKTFNCKIENPYYDIITDCIYFKLYIASIFNRNLILNRKYLEK